MSEPDLVSTFNVYSMMLETKTFENQILIKKTKSYNKKRTKSKQKFERNRNFA